MYPLKHPEIVNVLVAEDFVMNQHLIKIMLHSLGHNCTIAQNGFEAVKLFISGKFDLILMDIQMPVMDGIQAAKEIRFYEKEHSMTPIPIVVLTAQVLNNECTACKEAGVDDFVAKPISKEMLEEKIKQFFI